MSKNSSSQIKQAIEEHGWHAYESEKLGETIVLTKDAGTEVPVRWRNTVRYTQAEITALQAGPPVNIRCLRTIHKIKKIFGGGTVR